MIDLSLLAEEIQHQMDDASEDHLFVLTQPPWELPLVFGFELDRDGTMPISRREALKFHAVTVAKAWRASGGIGRAVVRLSHDKRGVVATISAWTSPHDAFNALRDAA